MKHGSLFSGIGGFDIAAEWIGWNNVFHCEINPFCQKVLKHHFPNAAQHGDIKQTDFTIHRGTIDVLTGGFPCQPYSVAGKRKGKEDDRHIWPEMFRAIREVQPRWVVGENVRGLVSWNGGLVFDEVQADLETEGYEVLPFLLPACAVNAPHKRDRIWFIAHTASDGDNRASRKSGSETERQNGSCIKQPFICSEIRPPSNTEAIRMERNGADWQQVARISFREGLPGRNYSGDNWQNFPTQSPICGGNDGLPTELDGITLSKWRNESIKAYGNSVVPQVVYQIFKAIEQYESAGN